MDETSYLTPGGVRVHRAAEAFDPDLRRDHPPGPAAAWRRAQLGHGVPRPVQPVAHGLPGPAGPDVARGRTISATALNQRGEVLLPVIAAALRRGAGAPGGLPGTRPRLGRRARRGADPRDDEIFTEEQRSRRPTVFSALREVIAAFAGPDPHLGLYGAFGYDLAFQFEPVRQKHQRDGPARDLVLHLPDQIYVVDRKRETATRFSYDFETAAGSTVGLAAARQPAAVQRAAPFPSGRELPADPQPGSYARVVELAREKFARGDLFEVVPSHRFYAPCTSPAAFFERLRERNPAPYEFFLNLGQDEYLVGASPEMYVRVTGERVETCPIAGTIARGEDAMADAEAIRTLLTSPKEESELTMCTDVDRNDKSRICVPGSIKVIGRRQIELYSRLIHTVDHVEGMLRPGFDALDAFLTHMWAVTVTGAPKNWAMQFIEDHEDAPRRWYGGAVGMIGFDGGMNTGLTLRTAHITGGVAAVRVGATLLFDSDPAEEERETGSRPAPCWRRWPRLAGQRLAGRRAAAQPPGPRRTRPARPGEGCGCCSSTTRTRSCTRWPATSASRART